MTPQLIIILVLIGVIALLMVVMARERGRHDQAITRYRERYGLDLAGPKSTTIEQHRAYRMEERLQSLHDRGWRVILKSHKFDDRDEYGKRIRGVWGWNVSAIPNDQARYVRWRELIGAVMASLDDALGDTERRVNDIEAVEASER